MAFFWRGSLDSCSVLGCGILEEALAVFWRGMAFLEECFFLVFIYIYYLANKQNNII